MEKKITLGTKQEDQNPAMAYSVGGESSSSSDGFSSTPKLKYDVFLSFAGKDTRLRFADHLYDALGRDGIKAFRDKEGIVRGENISDQLLQAIKDSLCAIVILSQNYANSTWCLDELQMILQCRSNLGQKVFPIFYDTDPSDVRYQRNFFGVALAKHEERFRENKDRVQNWRKALYEISNLSGWHNSGRHEADLIKGLVGEILNYVCSKLPSYDENLVGLESRMDDVMSYLAIGSDEVHFVGIWGMGGIGKTTLARVIYENISNKFEVFCFLSNVRETLKRESLVFLQRKLFSHLKVNNREFNDAYEGKIFQNLFGNKKVLLVLDDVDNMNQIQNLAPSPKCFGTGSRVIITTRDRHLLTSSNVDRIYDMKTMKKDESLQLFSIKAFNKHHPEKDYLKLSEYVVKYAGGLPLALEVLGSFLCRRSIAEWRDTLDRLKLIPNDNILQVLKISYDGLSGEDKTIFLDIVCFFKGWPKKEVTQILKACDLHPTIGIKLLIEKSLLVETEACRLEMHDLVEVLGKSIIYEESLNVGTSSRLWKLNDIKEVLENNKGSEAIQAIVMQDYYGNPNKIKVHREAFSTMSNIRLLLMEANSLLILPRGLKLPAALKVVRWPSFPFEALPFENPWDKLVQIQMYKSKIKQLWNGIRFMNSLKFIDLSYSHGLTETPNFSGVPYLERLCLRGCTSLVMVHHSLGELKELVEVYLDGCKNLEILPKKLETNSLIKLDLRRCKKVARLPEFGEGMKKLSYLDASYTSIGRLSESFGSSTVLEDLNFSRSKVLNFDDKLLKTDITRQISGLSVESLTELYLTWCGLNDGSIPHGFGNLSSLVILVLSGNNFVNLPTGCFSGLFRLLFLSLDYCVRLKSLPRLPPQLIRLSASNCYLMEPLSDRKLWNLVASLDHEHRGRTKYVISDEEYDDIPFEFKHVEPECLPLGDFCAIIPGSEIPSWFPIKEYDPLVKNEGECVIKVDIPPYFRHSEWSGIVVCFLISGFNGLMITWSSKAPEDDDYICNEWAHYTVIGYNRSSHLCIMVLELNEKTCWQHLRAHHYSLHIKLSPCFVSCYSPSLGGKIKILECGWRLLCKEEIKQWCHLNDFNQLAQPQLASSHEAKLPWSVLDNYIGKVDK